MTERAIYLTGAAVLLITALFSVGYHQFDEHFQILEFASEKLGLIEAEHLPWEYHYHFHSRHTAFQPRLPAELFDLYRVQK